MTFPPEVWGAVLRRIQSELPAHVVAAWLLPLVPEAGREGEFLLLCPSAFHRDRVRDCYLDTIASCLREEVGGDVAPTLGLSSRDTRTQPEGKRPDSPATRLRGAGSATPAPSGANAPIRATGGSATPRSVGNVTAMRVVRRGAAAQCAAAHETAPNPSRPAPARRSGRVVRPAHDTPTFESFVVGPCNSLAREASLALANESRGLRQLYLSSPHGLGKTHLSRAVVAEARRQDSARVLYASAETFTSEFMSSIQNRRTAGFKQRWRRECDVLVIEDIQFLAGKRATQLELFHTVQHVLDRGRRVLLTGDRPGHALTSLDERLRSQLAGGFAANISQPDAAVRCDILRAKASAGGIRVPDDCLDLIIRSVAGSVRELEGALIQIVTTASLMKRPIDLDLTRESLDRTTPRPERPRPTPEAIIKAVAHFFQTTPEKLSSRSRRRDILVPRQLAMYFSHRYTDATLSQIAQLLGRNHPSVRNAIARIEREMLERAPLRYKVEALSERLEQLGLVGDGPAPVADLAGPVRKAAKPPCPRSGSTAPTK